MKKRGMGLVELLVALGMMAFTLLAISSLFLVGLKSFHATTTDTNLNQTNAQGMRRIAETLRGALSITISNDGRTISYVLPKYSSDVDPTTGETELLVPVVSDGVQRSFAVGTSGQLTDTVSGRTMMSGIRLTDPDPNSSQYNQAYAPFSLTTIGSQKAVTLNFITAENVLGRLRYARLKTTVVLHNK